MIVLFTQNRIRGNHGGSCLRPAQFGATSSHTDSCRHSGVLTRAEDRRETENRIFTKRFVTSQTVPSWIISTALEWNFKLAWSWPQLILRMLYCRVDWENRNELGKVRN